MTSEYKGYSLFNDIEDVSLKAWNRSAVAINLHAMKQEEDSTAYLECLDSVGQNQVLAMIKYIKAVGHDKARINVFGKLKAEGGIN